MKEGRNQLYNIKSTFLKICRTFNLNKIQFSKGQLISKANCHAEDSSKNQTKNRFLLVCDVFSFVFWKNPRPDKKRFEIIWPLGCKKKDWSLTGDFFESLRESWSERFQSLQIWKSIHVTFQDWYTMTSFQQRCLFS